MRDKQLLELAAKAGGIDARRLPGAWPDRFDDDQWNPLIDDGDALRLAVKLDIGIGRSLNNAWWAKHWVSSKVFTESSERPDGRQDPCEALRRAIVRAAAEIGLLTLTIDITGAGIVQVEGDMKTHNV